MNLLQSIKVYDGIFIFAIIFFIVATFVVNCISGKNFPKINNDIDDVILKDAYYRRKIWLRSSITWLAIHYFIVLSTFLSTSIVIYVSMIDDEGKGKVLFYSIVSFFSSIITYIVNPYKTSLAYREAYMLIDFALLNNENIQKAIKKGEKLIHKGHK